MNEQEREDLVKEIDRHYKWFNTGSHMWSTLHHGSLYLAAFLSAASASLLKLEFFKDFAFRTDVAATLAAIAALLGTMAVSGGFQRKWEANRVNRGNLDQIRVELLDPEVDAKAIRNQLKEVIARHNKTIVGQQSEQPRVNR